MQLEIVGNELEKVEKGDKDEHFAHPVCEAPVELAEIHHVTVRHKGNAVNNPPRYSPHEILKPLDFLLFTIFHVKILKAWGRISQNKEGRTTFSC